MTTLYYLDRFTDEVMPCSPDLDSWAAFLGSDEVLEWGATSPIPDGERFTCSVAERVDAVARWSADGDGEWKIEPNVPYDWCAITFGPGEGWDADSIAGSISDLLAYTDKDEEPSLALMQDRPDLTLEFRGGKLIEVAPLPVETDEAKR